MNYELLTPEIQRFIKDHETHDPFQLVLNAEKYGDLPIKEVAAQIQARQKVKSKIPEWLRRDGIYFPPPLSIEQSSSEKAAQYKAGLIDAENVVDLTGGAGVDAYFFSKKAKMVMYVEKNAGLSEIARHNFKVLGAGNITVNTVDAREFLKTAGRADLIYIDPSRRGEQKVFQLEQSEPDVTGMIPEILQKTNDALIKTSPFLDIDRACQQLQPVKGIYVVSVDNECKEVLYHIGANAAVHPPIIAVNVLKKKTERFDFTKEEEKTAQPEYGMPQEYLYEPNSSILKGGAFRMAGRRFRLKKLHTNTHLYTSEEIIAGFPGKIFQIEEVFVFSRKFLKRIAGDMAPVNLIARNFPLSADQIKQETGLRDGGKDFLIFTTNADNQRIVLRGKRIVQAGA